ncbi:hypothetical protein ABW19_dt0207186 [Dactylella cylindrospora]|nr:hypothetical protein ABW19_dt0207186 [Dactylella cylindrospora]
MKVSTLILPIVATSTLVSAAVVPLVESNKLRRIIYRGNLRARAEELYAIAARNNNTRAWGTPGHWETLDWIYAAIPKDYYNVEKQFFNISRQIYDDVSVTVDGGAIENPVPFTNGINGTVSAPILAIPNLGCDAADYPAEVAGKIALVHRGTCPFGLKNALSKKAGAVGLVVRDNDVQPISPTLGNPADHGVDSFIVAAFIGRDVGAALAEKLGSGTLPASINSIFHIQVEETANIIATTKGGNQNQIITVGAHTDSVEAGPGINDNGSGTIAQIEVAKALTKFAVNNAIRFCWWSAEEDGLLGSEHYTSTIAEDEAAKIVMNLNFDMLASPNYLYSIYDGDGSTFESPFASNGSGQIEQTFIDFFAEDGKVSVPTEFDGRSDYDGFLSIGIPAGGVFTGAEGIKTEEEAALFGGSAGVAYDKCYHQACDDLTNLNYGAFITGAKSMADAIAKYGRSIEGFPFPRTGPAKLAKRRPSWVPSTPNKSKGRHGGCTKSQSI